MIHSILWQHNGSFYSCIQNHSLFFLHFWVSGTEISLVVAPPPFRGSLEVLGYVLVTVACSPFMASDREKKAQLHLRDLLRGTLMHEWSKSHCTRSGFCPSCCMNYLFISMGDRTGYLSASQPHAHKHRPSFFMLLNESTSLWAKMAIRNRQIFLIYNSNMRQGSGTSIIPSSLQQHPSARNLRVQFCITARTALCRSTAAGFLPLPYFGLGIFFF